MSYTPIRRHATAEDFQKWEEQAKQMTDQQLWYAARDCRQVEQNFRGFDPMVEGFYSDQAATFSDELRRRRHGR